MSQQGDWQLPSWLYNTSMLRETDCCTFLQCDPTDRHLYYLTLDLQEGRMIRRSLVTAWAQTIKQWVRKLFVFIVSSLAIKVLCVPVTERRGRSAHLLGVPLLSLYTVGSYCYAYPPPPPCCKYFLFIPLILLFFPFLHFSRLFGYWIQNKQKKHKKFCRLSHHYHV